MTHTQSEEEILEENEEHNEKPHIPEVAKKVSRFGNQWGMSKFGKGTMNFNSPNKQRPGRAAGRGR